MQRFCWALLLGLLLACCGRSGEFLLMSEDYPPFNYVGKDQKMTGVCVDIVREIQRRADTRFPVKLETWVDALKKLTATPNSALFSMASDHALRKKFTFVGPIANNEFCFFAAKNKDISLSNLEDAKQYRIGVFQNDICHQFLVGQGFTNLLVMDSEARHLSLLLDGKIDLWLTGRLKAYRLASEQKIALDSFKMLLVAFSSPLYIGFNVQTDTKIVEGWKKALAEMQKDGRLEAIKKEWIVKLEQVRKKQ